jgi:hypothetical protein
LGAIWLWWQFDSDTVPGLTAFRKIGTVFLLCVGALSLLTLPESQEWLIFGESAIISAVVAAIFSCLGDFALMGWQGTKGDTYFVWGVIVLSMACAYVAFLVGGKKWLFPAH